MIEPVAIQGGFDVYSIRKQFPILKQGSERKAIGLFG